MKPLTLMNQDTLGRYLKMNNTEKLKAIEEALTTRDGDEWKITAIDLAEKMGVKVSAVHRSRQRYGNLDNKLALSEARKILGIDDDGRKIKGKK